MGYAITWNLGVQHVFKKDYTVEARYVGTRGIHLIYQLQLNRAAVVTPTHFLPTYPFGALPGRDRCPAADSDPTHQRAQHAGHRQHHRAVRLHEHVTAYVPRGNSEYHGLALEMTRRFSDHLHFKAAYTWSHLLDDSTAEVNSTTLSPRRPQDFNNIRGDWASSALDHRQRITLSWLYETPWFQKDSNWMKKNILGNYQVSGAYSAESPEYVTPQSVVDSNQNGDAASDRVILNPNGVTGTSSGVTALKRTDGQTVAYLADNPNAQYIRAQVGALPPPAAISWPPAASTTSTLRCRRRLAFRERTKLQFRADFFNSFNHPQYTPGRVNNVKENNRANVTNFLTPGNCAVRAVRSGVEQQSANHPGRRQADFLIVRQALSPCRTAAPARPDRVGRSKPALSQNPSLQRLRYEVHFNILFIPLWQPKLPSLSLTATASARKS